jgi:hypothetical protein
MTTHGKQLTPGCDRGLVRSEGSKHKETRLVSDLSPQPVNCQDVNRPISRYDLTLSGWWLNIVARCDQKQMLSERDNVPLTWNVALMRS